MSKLYITGLLVLFLSGCASYSSSFQRIELLLGQQKPQEALLELEKHPATGTDKLLYLLDKAMLQRMSGLYAESNSSFELAKKKIDALSGTSLVEQAGALTVNDSVISYEGEDYEQVSIHLYAALNYIALGQLDEARVEALQVDQRLKELAEGDSEYVEDAFSRYLAGLIYEAEGELDNAMIAYRKAYQAYTKHGEKQGVDSPLFLKHDLLRLTHELGLINEFEKYKTAFKAENIHNFKASRKRGEVVLLLNTGLAPIKRSQSLFVNTDDGVPIRISMPVYQSRPSFITGAVLKVGEVSQSTELVDNIDAIARTSLESHTAAITARLIARAIAKNAISDNAKQQGGELAGFLADVAMMATETADTRSWLTLPKHIYLSRLNLAPGSYAASLSLLGRKGEVVQVVGLGDIKVEKGKVTFIEKTYIRPNL
ncbi:MAG: hypothetical protein R8M14_02515 [Ghiorsea sp.]